MLFGDEKNANDHKQFHKDEKWILLTCLKENYYTDSLGEFINVHHLACLELRGLTFLVSF